MFEGEGGDVMKMWRLLKINAVIAALSFVGFWLLEWPLEVFSCIGVSWVLISCVETLRQIHSASKKLAS